MIHYNQTYESVEVFQIEKNGVQVVEQGGVVSIYTDPFRSLPVFVYQASENDLVIFSDMETFLVEYQSQLKFDKVGFWEILLYGNSIWTRTLFENVYQLPAACVLKIDKNSLQFEVHRYWDYCVQEDKSINTIEKAVEGLDAHLNRVFSKLNPNQKYVMGMSGGMDSRITLAYLSKFLPKINLKLFTYGFNENILEYTYAQQVADALGFKRPIFHKLMPDSYRQALEYLPKKSGGQISINHCHMIDFFINNHDSESVNLSTYFTDAVFGWECAAEKSLQIKNPYLAGLEKHCDLDKEVKSQIVADSEVLLNSFNQDCNISSIDEYKYISERNQKFHIYLMFIQSGFKQSINPYLDFELLTYSLSVPLRYRANKKLIDKTLEMKFKNISSRDFKNISSRFQWGASFSGKFRFYEFKLLNRINAALRVLTKGKLQVLNPFQTEELERILYRDFSKPLENAVDLCVEKGLLNSIQAKEWKKLPLKSAGVSERFSLISIMKFL